MAFFTHNAKEDLVLHNWIKRGPNNTKYLMKEKEDFISGNKKMSSMFRVQANQNYNDNIMDKKNAKKII